MELSRCIEIGDDSSKASVIWLHGLGASGEDFVPMVPELGLGDRVKFIFPDAPQLPVTINGGYMMPAWYDILAITENRVINQQHFSSSLALIRELVEKELARGVAAHNIVLAGFSQGGAIAYELALSFEQTLGGLLCMSTYMAREDERAWRGENNTLPVMIHHGSYDTVVAESMGRRAEQVLLAIGYSVEFKTYPMEHQMCLAQVKDISAWLTSILND